MSGTVSVKELVDEITNLEVHSGKEYLEERLITTEDISRPGLELTGYFDYYPEERIQLFGMTEISYGNKMSAKKRLEIMNKLCGANTPCFVVSRYLAVPEEMTAACSKKITSRCFSRYLWFRCFDHR